MNRFIMKSIIIIVLSTIAYNTFAQDSDISKIKERYIVINDLNSFFEISENSVICYPLIHNIYENESSKPLHINVNELKNVIKFSIKSDAQEYENQRQSKLILNKEDYKNTFRNALLKMNIEYVLYDNNILTINDFYLLLNNK